MSTRGFLGFVADKRETITYVHYDAYPSALGADVLKWARTVTDWDAIRQQAANLVHVDGETMPTDEQRAALAQYAKPGADPEKDPGEEWYRLLYRTFGDPAATLASGYAPHSPDWPGDSVWCEWGYLIDLDEKKFELYQGFQTRPHKGRFADRPANERSGYYPVKVLASWPLDDLPDDGSFLASDD